MANVRKGLLTAPHEWWRHLRWAKRTFWKAERKAAKGATRKEIRSGKRQPATLFPRFSRGEGWGEGDRSASAVATENGLVPIHFRVFKPASVSGICQPLQAAQIAHIISRQNRQEFAQADLADRRSDFDFQFSPASFNFLHGANCFEAVKKALLVRIGIER